MWLDRVREFFAGLRPVLECMTVARSQLAVMPGDVRQRAEAVVLDLEDPVGMVERLGEPNERHKG